MEARRNKLLLAPKLSVLILTVFFVFPLLVWGQTPDPTEERKALETELKTLEEKISQYEKDIKATQKDKQTLQNQIKTLQNKIKKLDLEIRQGNLMVGDLKNQIKDTEASIGQASDKIEQTRLRLQAALRTLEQENRKGEVEAILTGNSLSDFFTQVVNLESLNGRITRSLADIRSMKTTLENEKVSLDKEKESLQRLVKVQSLQKQQSQEDKKQQEVVLEKTKGTEALYQKYLEETKKRAAEIRSRIFELIGIPQAPTFGQAYELAKEVEKATGLRPAFLLAVLTQESNIGKNVGQCYLKNSKTGEGIRVKTGETQSKVMAPGPPYSQRNDVKHFLTITQELGRDPYNTPVSCPIQSVGGYGGAMGPAQFIPETWVAYSQKIEEVIGKKPDPWNIKDAFFAAGLYLKNLGGTKNEFRAAMRYFSGGSWTKYEEFYGNSVLEIAAKYEEDIKTLNSNGQASL